MAKTKPFEFKVTQANPVLYTGVLTINASSEEEAISIMQSMTLGEIDEQTTEWEQGDLLETKYESTEVSLGDRVLRS